MTRTILILMLLIPSIGFTQSCINLPSSDSWQGQTKKGSLPSAPTEIVQVSESGENSYTISDISAGTLKALGGKPISITIEFNCDGSIKTTQKSTDYGNCIIDGGSFDSTNNILTIDWRLPENLINERTEISIK